MADDPNARPVTGEILASAQPSASRPPPAAVIDAEFETFSPPAAGALGGRRPASFAAPRPGMASLPKGSADGAAPGWLFGALAFAVAAIVFWVAGGHALVELPAFRSATLRIAAVTSRVDQAGARALLRIDGEAVNVGGNPASLPSLDIRVLDGGGGQTIYNLGTSGAELEPGGRFAFASRLPAPKNGVGSVSVTLGK